MANIQGVTNILIASVGGQGGLTLSRVLAIAAILDGYSVRTGESLGMAQRFGSVVSYVRVGRTVYAPTFSEGEADYVIGMELIETLRNIRYLREGGTLIVNDEIKPPISSSLGLAKAVSKDEAIKALSNIPGNVVIVPAKRLAGAAGNVRASNMVLLGVLNSLSKLLTDTSIERAIKSLLPGRKGETSLKAYLIAKEWALKGT